MDKRVIKFLLLSLFCVILIYTTHAQIVPDQSAMPICDQVVILNRIQSEQQATRKFITDTFDQKSAVFFAEAEQRMAYMENKLDSALDTAVISLSILWGAITLFVVALFTMFSRLMDRAKYKRLEKAVTENVLKEMNKKVEIKEGYVTMKQYTPDDTKAERERIQAQQRELQIRLKEETLRQQMRALEEQFSNLRKPQEPQPPIPPQSQNIPTFNVPPKLQRQPYNQPYGDIPLQ